MQHKLLARYPIGNPRRVWRQDNFVLSISNPGPKGLDVDDEVTGQKIRRSVKTCTEAGFNMLECLWASPYTGEQIVKTAEALGNRVLFQNLKRFGGYAENRTYCKTNDLAGVMRDMRPWNCVAGYFVWDEPTPDEELQTVRDMIDLCEREQPEKLAFTAANPSYKWCFRWEEGKFIPYIDRFSDIIDPPVLSFDYYPIGRNEYSVEGQLDGSHLWYDLEVVRRAAAKRGMPMWHYYQGQKYHFHEYAYDFTAAMARMLANAGILYGVKGLHAYTEFEGPVNPEDGGPGIFFEQTKQYNTEIRTLNNTLMALTCDRVIHDSTLLADCPVMAEHRTPMGESELLTGELSPRISISEHSDAYGNRYLMVLNRDFEKSAHIELKLKNPSHVYKVSREDGEQKLVYYCAKRLQGYFAPGMLEIYRIQPGEEEPFTVEYYLEKSIQAR